MTLSDAFLCALFTLLSGAAIAAVIVLLVTCVEPWVGLAAALLIVLGLMTAGIYLEGRDRL